MKFKANQILSSKANKIMNSKLINVEILIPAVQDLVKRFKKNALPFSPEEIMKIRLEKERIFRLNEKIYGRTNLLKEASREELREHTKNKIVIGYLNKLLQRSTENN